MFLLGVSGWVFEFPLVPCLCLELFVECQPLFWLEVRWSCAPGRRPYASSDNSLGAKVVSPPANWRGASVTDDFARLGGRWLQANFLCLRHIRFYCCEISRGTSIAKGRRGFGVNVDLFLEVKLDGHHCLNNACLLETRGVLLEKAVVLQDICGSNLVRHYRPLLGVVAEVR